jgi:hypothetical protein
VLRAFLGAEGVENPDETVEKPAAIRQIRDVDADWKPGDAVADREINGRSLRRA